MLIEQGLTGLRDGHHICHRAVAEARYRALVEQLLALQRANVLAEAGVIAAVALQVSGKDDAKPSGALEEVHFGAT